MTSTVHALPFNTPAIDINLPYICNIQWTSIVVEVFSPYAEDPGSILHKKQVRDRQFYFSGVWVDVLSKNVNCPRKSLKEIILLQTLEKYRNSPSQIYIIVR